MLSILDVLPAQDKPRLWLVARDGLAVVSEEGPPAYDLSARPGGDEPRAPVCMMPSVIVRDYGPKVGAIPLAVYLVLTEHVNRDALCWPSHETIAQMLCLSKPTVIKALAILAEHGLIEVRRRRDKSGRDTTNVYRLPNHCTYRVNDVYPGVNPVYPEGQAALPLEGAGERAPVSPDFPVGAGETAATEGADPGVKEIDPGVNVVDREGQRALPKPYTDEPDLNDPPIGPPKTDEPKRRASRAPASFDLTEHHYALATRYGVTADRVEPETEKFLDHHRAKGTLFVDWQAGWRTWMQRVVRFGQNGYQPRMTQAELNSGHTEGVKL